MRRTRKDIEREWYDCFSRWNKGDRTAALKVLNILHEQLPDAPRSKQPADGGQQTLPGELHG